MDYINEALKQAKFEMIENGDLSLLGFNRGCLKYPGLSGQARQ